MALPPVIQRETNLAAPLSRARFLSPAAIHSQNGDHTLAKGRGACDCAQICGLRIHGAFRL
jgi:hypothetical protein